MKPIEEFVHEIMSYVAIKPDQMKIKASTIGGEQNPYIFIEVSTEYQDDVGRMVGKRGTRKISIKGFMGLCLKKYGYINSVDALELRILNA